MYSSTVYMYSEYQYLVIDEIQSYYSTQYSTNDTPVYSEYVLHNFHLTEDQESGMYGFAPSWVFSPVDLFRGLIGPVQLFCALQWCKVWVDTTTEHTEEAK